MRPGVRGRVQGHRLSERDKPQLVITFDAKSHEKNRWPRCSFLADFTNGVTARIKSEVHTIPRRCNNHVKKTARSFASETEIRFMKRDRHIFLFLILTLRQISTIEGTEDLCDNTVILQDPSRR